MFAPEEQRGDLTSLLQEPTGDKAKHGKVYKFKSGNVVEHLKQLKGKFVEDLLEAEKAKTNSVNAFDMATKSLENRKKFAETSKEQEEDSFAAAEVQVGRGGGRLEGHLRGREGPHPHDAQDEP